MILNIFTILFSFLAFELFASTVYITQNSLSTNILPQSQIFIDKDSNKTFDEVYKADKIFKDSKIDYLRLGYTDKSAWVRFKLHNNSNVTINKLLEVDNSMLDTIELYTITGDAKHSFKRKGVLHNRTFDGIINFYYKIELKPDETKEFYFKSHSLSCANYFKLNIINKDELFVKELDHQLILALTFGALIILVLYNFFIYIFTRSVVYIYYVGYILSWIFAHVSYSGFGLHYAPLWFVEIDAFLGAYYVSASAIFAILFTSKFLNLAQFRKIDIFMKVMLGLMIVFTLFSYTHSYILDYVVHLALFIIVSVVFVTFYAFFKGVKDAKYIVVSWTIGMLGIMMLIFYQYGIWSIIQDYPYFFEFTLITEATLFSVALASKLNKTDALTKSVQLNKTLTIELHHRVKNNMQFIISLYRLKLEQFTNKQISNSLNEIERNIQTISEIYDMLCNQDIISNIDTPEYIQTLINKLKGSFSATNININIKVTTNLNIDDSIYVGIILNELITNSIKYAFNNSTGNINISLSKKDLSYELLVCDDGVGFDNTKQRDSFGLDLIEILAQEELNAKIELDSTNGTTYKIVW